MPATPALAIGPAGIALIQSFEACGRLRPDGRYSAYPDPASGGAPWTIGWGSTGPDIRAGLVWTRAQCDARFASQLARFAGEVERVLGSAPTGQHQFDALVAFHYNTGAIGRAQLTRDHIAGRYAEAAAGFSQWVHAGGKLIPGLVRRRAAEAALYATADDQDPPV